MSNGQFWDSYRARQLRVEAPEELKARTRELIESESNSCLWLQGYFDDASLYKEGGSKAGQRLTNGNPSEEL